MTSRFFLSRHSGEPFRVRSLTERLRGVFFQVLWPQAIPQPRPIAVTTPRAKESKKPNRTSQPRP